MELEKLLANSCTGKDLHGNRTKQWWKPGYQERVRVAMRVCSTAVVCVRACVRQRLCGIVSRSTDARTHSS